MSDRVTVVMDGGVADVRLSRPDKLNALDQAMFEALVETGTRLAADTSLRAVVLSGEGRAFCAGLDFASFMGMASADSASDRPRRDLLDAVPGSPANFAQSAAYVWSALPVPVIAAVHGVAFGGGLQIALAADMRFVAPGTEMSVMEIKWGLIPDMTGTQTLRHLVRLDVAKELTFTGRRIGAEEAVALGLATCCVEDPHAVAMETAREIARKSPTAVRAGKKLLDRAYHIDPAEGLALEESVQRTLLGSPNQMEAVMANLEKRDPKFQDPE
jgi:enoyl-CoA hydratase/carnithine racemase